MKRWNDLDETEQREAINKSLNNLLDAVAKNIIRFDDELNQDTLQKDIDAAIEEANQNRTPWFATEYIMEAVGPILRGMAMFDAENAYYPECGERIIRLSG